jgi:hypothetical protein
MDSVNAHDVELLDKLQQGFYQKESALLQNVRNESKQADIDLPTIMNMLREINNSNESLLRSLRHLIEREL